MKSRVVSTTLLLLGILMISIAVIVKQDNAFKKKTDKKNNTAMDIVSVINMSSTKRDQKLEVVDLNSTSKKNKVIELSMEQTPQSIYIPPRIEVYEGMTIEELSAKLDRSLKGVLSGKGNLIAKTCLETNVDPYIAVAIMLHETGCRSRCSTLAVQCNNVGGQKGSPRCGNGSYKAYSTIDEGIVGVINNLSRNYFAQGRTTVETIAPKYAEGASWPSKINWYVNLVRTN